MVKCHLCPPSSTSKIRRLNGVLPHLVNGHGIEKAHAKKLVEEEEEARQDNERAGR